MRLIRNGVPRFARHTWIVVTVAVAVSPAWGQDSSELTDEGVEWWKGTVQIPGAPLDFAVALTPGDSKQYTGKMDIPVQGAKGLELADVDVTSSEMSFTIPAPADAKFELRLSHDGKSAIGKMWQRGLAYSVRMSRTTAAEAKTVGPARPQTPKPPFPYSQRDVTYVNPKDGTTLAGTLTVPTDDGLHPAATTLHGEVGEVG